MKGKIKILTGTPSWFAKIIQKDMLKPFSPEEQQSRTHSFRMPLPMGSNRAPVHPSVSDRKFLQSGAL